MTDLNQLVPVVIWVGHASIIEDLVPFCDAFDNHFFLPSHGIETLFKIDDSKKAKTKLHQSIIKILSKKERNAIFVVLTRNCLNDNPDVHEFIKIIKETNANKNDRVYVIAMDWNNHEEVKQYGALPCYMDFCQSQVGARRCVELISRIVGYNRPGYNQFPDYDDETLWKMALHINLENFNKDTPRLGALSKQAFENGLPIFPEVIKMKNDFPDAKIVQAFHIGEILYANDWTVTELQSKTCPGRHDHDHPFFIQTTRLEENNHQINITITPAVPLEKDFDKYKKVVFPGGQIMANITISDGQETSTIRDDYYRLIEIIKKPSLII